MSPRNVPPSPLNTVSTLCCMSVVCLPPPSSSVTDFENTAHKNRAQGNRISARFEYEWYDEDGQWYRTHGNEHWEFDGLGYMRWRDMSANDIPIDEKDRRLL